MPRLNVLKGKLLENGKTYLDCATVLGISISAFNEKMNGKTKFNIEEANSLANFINLSKDERLNIFFS